jgi:tetratricopeptide (TPR) repeat protein
LLARGHDSEKLGAKDDALADYTLAIESRALTGDDQVRALFDRGLLLDGMGHLDDALNDYGAALSLSPKFVAALNNRAGIYRRLGRWPEARRDYLAAIAIGSSQSQYSYFGLGQIAEAEGKRADAEALYRCALAADPHYSVASDRLSALSREAGPPTRSVSVSALPQVASIRSFEPEKAPAPSAAKNILQLKSTPADNEGGPEVQLGAWRSPESAAKGWSQAQRLAKEALDGLSPRIVAVDLPGAGRFYRLRVTAAQTSPRALCTALASKGLDCVPTWSR